MLSRVTRLPASAMFIAAVLCSGVAQAQNTQQAANANDNKCQTSTSGANGKASDADLDGTYSACSLANGFIGFGARTNDGTNQTPEFGLGESDQVLRHPQAGERDHRLANLLAQQGDNGTQGSLRTGRASGEYRFGTRDFVSVQESPTIDNTGGYRGATRGIRGASDEYAALVTSSGFETGAPAGGGGVGGGGAGGGIDSGSNGNSLIPPVTPAVPEPGTWAMLMAGLAVLSFAVRRKT